MAPNITERQAMISPLMKTILCTVFLLKDQNLKLINLLSLTATY